jgi:hypothetical protein
MAISWKWPKHSQKWPTSQLEYCFPSNLRSTSVEMARNVHIRLHICQSNLQKSCGKFYWLQTLFLGHLMNLPLTLPKFSFSTLLDSCYLLKPVPVLCLVSLQLCRSGLDSLKQSCREFLKLQAHLEIQLGSWGIGQGIHCHFWLCNVAMFQYAIA